MCSRDPTCERPNKFHVYLNGKHVGDICPFHRQDLMRRVSPRRMKPLPGVRFERIEEEGKSFFRRGHARLDVDELHEATDIMNKRGKATVVQAESKGGKKQYVMRGVTRRDLGL